MKKYSMPSRRSSYVHALVLAAVFSFASAAQAAKPSEHDCAVWGKNMADSTAPVSNSMMGMMQPGAIMGPMMGSMGSPFIAPLTDDVKTALGDSRAAIQSKYEQLVVAEHEYQVEWGSESEAAIKNGNYYGMGLSEKLKKTTEKVQLRIQEYKTAMFAFGQQGKCMGAFESAVAQNLMETNANTSAMFQKLISQKDARIKHLEKAGEKALSALQHCQPGAPDVAGKTQKYLEDVLDGVNEDGNTCPLCGVGMALPPGTHPF